MNHSEIESFFNHHCRIKLRSGKEVYGVLWQDLSETDKAIYFASYIAHKKMLAKQKSGSLTEIPLRLSLEDILGIEPIEP
jgi:hypothetical protein